MNDQQAAIADDYAVWNALLNGERPEIERGVPYCGHWRIRDRQGKIVPVNIWRGPEGKIVGRVGRSGISMTVDEAWCERIMAYALKSPITETEFRYYQQWGRWSDDAPGWAVEASNLPADEFEAWRIQTESEWDELARALTTDSHLDDAGARTFGNWRIRFNQLWATGNALRKAEKLPHDEAAHAVQKKFAPLLDKLNIAKSLIDKSLTEYLVERQAKLEDTAGRAPAYDMPDKTPKAAIDTVGRKVTLVRSYRAAIYDYQAALNALKDHPDIKAAVQAVADASARSKAKLPIAGVEYIETTSAR